VGSGNASLEAVITWNIVGASGGQAYSCSYNASLNFGGVPFPGGFAPGTASSGCQAP
jgi:hypothetical protein